MPVKTFRPLTPSTRYIAYADYSDITKGRPEKSLVQTRKRTGGRNAYGRVTARGIGGGNKQKIRLVDFKRNKHGVEATVKAIEYDPRRTARLALLEYQVGGVIWRRKKSSKTYCVGFCLCYIPRSVWPNRARTA